MYLNPVIVTLAICSSVFVNAQSIERSVISSFGMHYTGAALQTDCTIGEVITFTGETENGFLTQG
ncbi:MAG: hypothetical protein ACKVOR_11635, partial [Flavobacteriales bacterium]